MKTFGRTMILVCLLAVSAAVSAQTATDISVFVAPTTDGFSNFVSAAFLENKMPVKVTMDENAASYIIVCGGVRGQNKWYDTVFGMERDRNQGSMKLVRVSDRTVVWAGSAGDKSYWLGEFKGMGQSKVANRLVRKLKDDLPKLHLEATSNAANAAAILSQANPNARATAEQMPTTVAGLAAIGIERFGQQRFAEAEAAFRDAIKLDPYNAVLHHNLGTALNAQGKVDEAIKEIELATRLAPNEQVFKKSLEVVKAGRP